MKRVWVLAVAALAVVACEEEAPEVVSTETGGEAAGEVLGGTISDDMIPLEELTSTSPPAERTASPDRAAVAGAAPAEGSAANDASDPASAPASAPAPDAEAAAPPPRIEPAAPFEVGPARPIPQDGGGSEEPPAS